MGCWQSYCKGNREKIFPKQKGCDHLNCPQRTFYWKDKRYELIRSGINRSCLKIKKMRLYKYDELVEVNSKSSAYWAPVGLDDWIEIFPQKAGGRGQRRAESDCLS